MATKKHLKKGVYKILLGVFAIMLICSIIGIGLNLYESNKAKAGFEELRVLLNSSEDNDSSDDNGLKLLKEENDDLVAWVTIPDTTIDYPVMYTPDDPEYYLRRAFDKSDSNSGTPFIGKGCTINSNSLIIYSHNMKNGTMFAPLTNYEDESYLETHSLITLTTLNETRQYEIFAAMRITLSVDDVYSYYTFTGDIDSDQFDLLMDFIEENQLYETNVSVDSSDDILMLSTCSYHSENGRFVIAAKRIS